MDHYRLFIGGELVEGARGEKFETIDPGSGQPIATVARASEADANAAVDAARRAFDSGVWSKKTPGERAEIMLEFADLIQASSPKLATLEAMDSGGVIMRTYSDLFMGAKFIRTMANYAAAYRNFSDSTMNGLWRGASAALSKFVNVPANAELWHDVRDIPALRDAEELRQKGYAQFSIGVMNLVNAGFDALRAAAGLPVRQAFASGSLARDTQPFGAVPPDGALDLATAGEANEGRHGLDLEMERALQFAVVDHGADARGEARIVLAEYGERTGTIEALHHRFDQHAGRTVALGDDDESVTRQQRIGHARSLAHLRPESDRFLLG